jgi:hypothetical protein
MGDHSLKNSFIIPSTLRIAMAETQWNLELEKLPG